MTMQAVNAILAAPQVQSITRREVIARFLRETQLGVYGTVVTGDVDHLTDQRRLQSRQYNAGMYQGGWARIAYRLSAVGTAPEGQIVPIGKYTPATSRVDLDYNLSVALAAGDIYELWRVDPKLVLDFLDDVLQEEVFLPCWTGLSEVPDYDMENVELDNWTGVGINIGKQLNPSDTFILGGAQHLFTSCTNVLGNGYARSQLLNVQPGGQYYVDAIMRSTTTGTGKLQVWDEINNAEIASVSSNSRFPVRLNKTFNTPSNCSQISIRLVNVDFALDIEWDEVRAFGLGAKSISLPWWVKDKSQVRGIFKDSQINSIDGEHSEATFVGEPDTNFDIRETAFGNGKLQVVPRQGTINGPLFMFGVRNEVAFIDDNQDIKHVEARYINACLAYRVFDYLANTPNSGLADKKWIDSQLAKWTKQWKDLRYDHMERLSQVLTSRTPWRLYGNESQANSVYVGVLG